jgi:hypothetical protein
LRTAKIHSVESTVRRRSNPDVALLVFICYSFS